MVSTGSVEPKLGDYTKRLGLAGSAQGKQDHMTGLLDSDARLTVPAGVPIRITPTDISQYIRLGQCRRYLRLRLVEQNAGRSFMRELGVTSQAIPPLLTRSGRLFEERAEAALSARFPIVRCGDSETAAREPRHDNALVIEATVDLGRRESVALLQPRLACVIDGWDLRGIADLLLLQRDEDGDLSVLIVDFKSSITAKVEHRLQVAFYLRMLAKVFGDRGITASLAMGVLYRGQTTPGVPQAPDSSESDRTAALQVLGVADAFLELSEDPTPYLDVVEDLLLSDDSVARRVAAGGFDSISFHLDYKCDGCLYNEFCLRWSAERDDLSLVPLLAEGEKGALERAGVRSASELAAVKQRDETGKLMPAAGAEALVRRLGATWGIGTRLDELVLRAQRYRRFKGDSYAVSNRLPLSNHSSLPICTPEVHPNLVTVTIDAQHDYLNDRVYLLGSHVAAASGGVVTADHTRTIVKLADGPPADDDDEATLLREWLDATLAAIGELATPDNDGERRAPVHLIFYDRYDQRVVLDMLGRHGEHVFAATPLYDFVCQLAAFDSPVLTFLVDEIRTQRNYPMLCQSMQSVATFLGFSWDRDRALRTIFRERFFDAAGVLETGSQVAGETTPWYTARSRFNSQIPLEYAYAAWGELPLPAIGERDDYARYRLGTSDDLVALQARRLEAAVWIASTLTANDKTTKRSFDLSVLDRFEDVAGSLADALDEFVVIERHVELAGWRSDRLVAPERRVLGGESMIVQYLETDQPSEVANQNRDNREREQEQERLRDDDVELTKQQKLATRWSQVGLPVRLRIDLDGVDCDLEHVLAASVFGAGDRVIVYPRWTFDSRLPEDKRLPFTPTPRQLLYGSGASVERIDVERDADGRAERAWICLSMEGTRGSVEGFVFNHYERTFEAGCRYTIESDPNDWFGSFLRKLTLALRGGEQLELYRRIAERDTTPLAGVGLADESQRRFMDGLVALAEIGDMPPFEPSKRRYIAELADAPIVLVQGPPGTGKSYTTAYAIFARIQAAMTIGRPLRVIVSSKTHAAVDVLLKNIVETREQIRAFRLRYPDLTRRFFDERLADIQLYRCGGRSDPPHGVHRLDERVKGELWPIERIQQQSWCVIAATPGGVRKLVKQRKSDAWLTQNFCDLLVLDEASQISLPEALLASVALKDDGRVIVVGDHRQMPPIVKNDWQRETRRSFTRFRAYESLFLTLKEFVPEEHQIRFAESFRLHADTASFLRREIYRHDGIAYFSRRIQGISQSESTDTFVHAALDPAHPLTVIVHDEEASQQRNAFEEALIRPILEELADRRGLGLDPRTGLGVVVPHRAQRTALREHIDCLSIRDPGTGLIVHSAVDTVERFQGGERSVIVVSATESDPRYLLTTGDFLLDPRRLNVAISRAKEKLILVAARGIFDLFSADEQTFADAQLWKNLLRRTCTELCWEGVREGYRVQVWGNVSSAEANLDIG